MAEHSPYDLCHLYRDHADIRREVQTGFGDTRYNLAERAGDIRREASEHTNEIVKEGIKSECSLRGDIKDARFDVSERVGNQGDRIVDRLADHDAKVSDRFFDVGRDTHLLRGQVSGIAAQVSSGFQNAARDMEVQALKTQLDAKQNTQYLSDKICVDGEKTRALINELKNAEYNRLLIERNAEIVEHRHYGHHWRGTWDQTQWQNLSQQLANQTANFNSQLSEARQGMVNFGTMAGNAGQQTSTNNNVR